MTRINFGKTNGFDDDDTGTEGGLLGMVQRAMQEQGMSSDTVPMSRSLGAFAYNSDYDSQPRGLLGRLLALQAERNPQSSLAANTRSILPELAKSSSGPVSSAVATNRLKRFVGVDGSSDDQSYSSYPFLQDSTWRDGLSGLAQRSMKLQPYIEKGASEAPNESPTVTAQLVLPGRSLPFPPARPGTVPSIPSPAIPDWWTTAWKLLQLFPRIVPGLGGGKNNGDECYDRETAERQRCFERQEDYAHRDFLQACLDRAGDRRNLCVRNGGRPHPLEPPEWGINDEEIYRNPDR